MTSRRPKQLKRVLPLALATLTATFFATPLAARAATAPLKEIVSSHIGAETDETTKADICTVASGHKCQPAKQSGNPGAFNEAQSVAVDSDPASPEHGDVYVADQVNNRVQVLTPSGQFVLMFGKDVNKQGGDTCTAAEQSECQAGQEGAVPGQLSRPQDVAIDPTTGDVYILDYYNYRVEEFTADGEFVLMIGKDVNETTGGNLCSEMEVKTGAKCKSGVQTHLSTEPGAFNFSPDEGNLLAVGDNGVLYIADEHRVQEFDGESKPVGEIRAPLEAISAAPESRVTALTVNAAGDVFLVYQAEVQGATSSPSHTVREFDSSGHEVDTLPLAPQHPQPGNQEELEIRALGVDPTGRLAVAENERYYAAGKQQYVSRGSLYEVGAGSARRITEFSDELTPLFAELFASTGSGLAFSGEDLYASGENELVTFTPVPVASAAVSTAPCSVSGEQETDVSLACSLNASVDPWGVPGTEAWFEWGTSAALGRRTSPSIAVASSKSEGDEEPPAPVSAPIAGLLPNEAFFYRLAAFDPNNKAPESPLISETASAKTPSVPPTYPRPAERVLCPRCVGGALR